MTLPDVCREGQDTVVRPRIGQIRRKELESRRRACSGKLQNVTRFPKSETVVGSAMEITGPDRDVCARPVDVGKRRVGEPDRIGEGELTRYALQSEERLWSGRLVEVNDMQRSGCPAGKNALAEFPGTVCHTYFRVSKLC